MANASGVHLSGSLAWIVWACMHVMNLVTFRNRLWVFIQCAFQDLTFRRVARPVTGTAPADFSFNKEVAIHAGALKMEPEHLVAALSGERTMRVCRAEICSRWKVGGQFEPPTFGL